MAEPLEWSVVKERWEAGEDDRSIAIACRRKVADIQAMATLEGWSDKRRSTLKPRTHDGKRKSAAIVLREPVSTPYERVSLDVDPADLAARLDGETANAHHLHDHERLRLVALNLLTVAAEAADARLLTAVSNALKVAQEGQRKALRLDAKQDTTQGDFDAAMQEIDQRANPTVQVPDVP